MGLIIDNSPDISLLSAEVIFDISGVTPKVIINNLSQGDALANVSYAFKIFSPTTTAIHDGTLSDRDITGVWAQYIENSPWPRPFNQIEFGGQYTFQILAKDSNGSEYSAPVQSANICRPNGNLPTSTNTYGVGNVLVQTKCEQARIYFQDTTNTSYKGLTGAVGSSLLKVNFPMDDTGTVPSPFQINYFTSAMVPVTYSGKGYQFLYSSIWDYDLGNDVTVRIKYVKNDTFGVWCNISLMPLICEYQKLINSIENGSCSNAEEANRKLMLINPKFSLLVIGIFQPLTGINVPELIEEIKEIGGFDCDCCNVGTGIIPAGSSAFDGYTFSVVPLGGDIEGDFVVNGYNIQLQLSDVAYVFKICDESPAQSSAFQVIPTVSGDGYTKTYCLNVDMVQLSEDILNTIKTDANLVNLFNSIVTNGGNQYLVVDGKCIFSSSTTSNYLFTLTDIPSNTTFAIASKLTVSGNNEDLGDYSFNMTNLAALQAHLNTLGFGTFVVTAIGANSITISSASNAANITGLLYLTAANPGGVWATFSSTSSGFVPLTTSQVVQNIINYLCAINDTQVYTSQAYEICYVDETGTKQTQTISIGESIASVLTALAERGCTTIDYIVALSSINCANIKAQFPQVITEIMEANDVFLATKNGICAGVYPTEALLTMLTYGAYSPDVIAAFCILVNLCNGGNICEPYNIFFAEVEQGSPSSDLVVTFSHPSAVSNIIRYARIDNTVSPVYTTVAGVLPGDSPYSITGINNGQYRVGITPVYSDGRTCPETFYDTAPCEGVVAFNATFDGTNIIITGTLVEGLSAKVTLNYPNGGTSSYIYTTTEGSLNQSIAPPSGVYGTFFATVQPVCDISTGFLGVSSAPASFLIEETSP